MRRTLAQRFADKTSTAPHPKGCHIWQGCKNNAGYGQVNINGKTKLSHRVAFELIKGEIPAGMEVLHSCDTHDCVNPEHLSVGTHAQNMAEASERNRFPNQLKTECPHGHPYKGKNILMKNGRRSCRTCHYAAVAKLDKRIKRNQNPPT